MRWRTLKIAQKDILEDVLERNPEIYQRPLLCAPSCSLAVQTNPQMSTAPGLGAQPQTRMTAPTATHLPSVNISLTPLSNDGTATTQTSPSIRSPPGHSASAQNSYQQKKSLWFIFKIEGAPTAPTWDQFGDEALTTDRSFQQKLRQSHNKLRGRLRLWFSYWKLSYWEFVKVRF
jgi:hypothetical protein